MAGDEALTRFGADNRLTIGTQPPVELPPLWDAAVTVPMLVAVLAAVVGVIAVVLAAIWRGPGALRLLGATVATRDGAPISRSRAMFRSFIAWSPALAAVALMLMLNVLGSSALSSVEWSRGVVNGVIGLIAIAVLAAGAVCSILAPRFSLHDRIARTVVIPL